MWVVQKKEQKEISKKPKYQILNYLNTNELLELKDLILNYRKKKKNMYIYIYIYINAHTKKI